MDKGKTTNKENSFILNSSLVSRAPSSDASKGDRASADTQYVISGSPLYTLPTLKPSTTPGDDAKSTSPPKFGVSEVRWSSGGSYLSCRIAEAPTCVFVWSLASLQLAAVLVHKSPVTSMSWHSADHTLAVCTQVNRAYIWTPSAASSFAVPFPAFSVVSVML